MSPIRAAVPLDASVGVFAWGDKADGSEDVNLNLGLYGNGTIGGEVAITTDHRPGHEGERVTTMTTTASGDTGVNAVLFGGELASGEFTGAIQIHEAPGPDGAMQVTGVTFMRDWGGQFGIDPSLTTGPLGGENSGTITGSDRTGNVMTQTITHLEVDDSNRAIVEQWMQDSYTLTSQAGGTPTLLIPPNAYAPVEPVNDPMGQLLYDRGVTVIDEYETTDDNFGFGLEVALGFKGGFSADLTDEETTFLNSQALGDKSPDGKRRFVPNDVCDL